MSESVLATPPDKADPRLRLLDAAGQVFAEKGFKAATVREICGRVNANVAAVNYYFRDKMGLYVASVEHAHACSTGDTAVVPLDLPPAEQLKGFIGGMLSHLLDPNSPAWHTQLLMRELGEPTEACAAVVNSYIRPKAQTLGAIVRNLVGEPLSPLDELLLAFSVVGQCLFYKIHKPMIRELVGETMFRELEVDRLAEHIFRFSLAGLLARQPVSPTSASNRTGDSSSHTAEVPASEGVPT